ncbi:MAG TPA: 3-isopropylmalate dehydratase large subunit [Victivallales bacterium]|nr:3-isopropylmalate dehydratase large subunit [Victivallales bacterium]HRR05648.1 3-isopropylmalate dehydratase large subunit [Victivallales bacterium]HRU01123.1 3-isopropylmalate dehydratase large subunit [Victivallales bacterium]
MTITEKILAKASGRKKCEPGENIWVSADILMTHDVCGPGTIGVFKREFGANAKVWDREKVIIIPDHYIFTSDEKSHRNIDFLRDFVKEQNLPYFYEPDTERYSGVCHLTLPEKGHCRPGEVLFGTDSHTCTHGAFGEFATGIGNTDAGFVMGTGKLLIKVPASIKFIIDGDLPEFVTGKDIILKIIGDIGVDGATYCAMEFCGSTIDSISIEERMTICNMAIEAGAKNGIIAPDQRTIDYVKSRTNKTFDVFYSEPDAKYLSVYKYKASDIEPVAALPFSPDNVKKISEIEDYKIDRVYIGSCTGGKISDFEMAAKVLYGRKVVVPTFLVPATVEVERALSERKINGKTLLQIFNDAGCEKPAPPSCAACLGGPVDTYGRCNNDEICVSTTNRNFPGRMGSKNSKTILVSPYSAAASAIKGKVASVRDL